jgi:cytidylate kinase
MKLHHTVPVITIDGPAGTGKGTVCHALAKKLGWHCLDSGAIYRVFALAAHQSKCAPNQIQDLCELARNLDLRFNLDADSSHKVLLNETDVTQAIRTEACGQWASQFAVIPEIRASLLERQRQFAKLPGLVTDGRDMGTVVFPDALLKIFLIASRQERAKRRILQLQAQGIDVSLAQVVEELTIRDERDSNRSVAPMRPATDAVVIDTTEKSIDEVLNEILDLISDRLRSN